MEIDKIIATVRAIVATGNSRERVQSLWAAAKFANKSAAPHAVADAFMQLALDVNLIDRAGYWTGADIAEQRRRYGRTDIEHVIRWALRNWNPFERGPLT